MTPVDLNRPRVSRETRLLLATILISVVALSVLARLRFPDRPSTPNPVPPVLAQLAPQTAFEDLALAVSQLQPRLAASLIAVGLPNQQPLDRDDFPRRTLAALRFREDLAITLFTEAREPWTSNKGESGIVARDPASGLTLIRVPPADSPELATWAPRRRDYPRYLIAADVLPQGPSPRPVFLGALYSVWSPVWPGSIWEIPPATNLAAGTFVFTTEGALVGLVIERNDRPAIVPGDIVLMTAERIARERNDNPGQIGITVQALLPGMASVRGSHAGIVITSVDPRGPSAGQLAVADVIEAVDDQGIPTLEDWQARIARLRAGESISLRVLGSGGVRNVHVTAMPPNVTTTRLSLGVTMRAVRGVGVEVLRVQPGSSAARAGLESGDVITLIGDLNAPTPAQVATTFAASSDDRPVLVAVTRGEAHHVWLLEKR
jgi:hypothetical protein